MSSGRTPGERPRFPTREGLRARAQLEGAQVLLRGDAPPLALRRTLEMLVTMLERPSADGPQPEEILRAVEQSLGAASHPERACAALAELRGGPSERLRPESFARLERAIARARQGSPSGRLPATVG